jgi:hypothetical protein
MFNFFRFFYFRHDVLFSLSFFFSRVADNSLMNCDGLYHFSPFLTGLALPLFLQSNRPGHPSLWLPEVLFPVIFGCLLTYV